MATSSVGLKVRVGFTFGLIVLGLTGLGSYRCITDLAEASTASRRCHKTLVALTVVGSTLRLAEVRQRDFILNRSRTYLTDPDPSEVVTREIFSRIRSDVPLGSPRRIDLEHLETMILKRLSGLREAAARPNPLARNDEDQSQADTISRALSKLATEEEKELQRLEAQVIDTSEQAALILAAACIVSILIALISWLMVARDVAAREEVEAELEEARLSLEQRVSERTAELARTNAELRQEIFGRQKTEQELQRVRLQLEERVDQRAADLARANSDLRQEIRERAQVMRALRETTTLQQAILNSANYAIISTEADGTIRTLNAAALRWLNYAEHEVVSRRLATLFHDPRELNLRQEELSHEMGMAIDSGFEVLVTRARLGVPDEQEWSYLRKDGTRFPVLLSVTALRDDSEDVLGFLLIGSDITERKRYEEELRRARDQAESANRTKSEFLANMSHELRTPLNSVIGFTSILLKNKAGTLREQDLAFLQRVLENGKHLLGLINQVLDLAKVEAGRLEVERAPVDLSGLVRETLAQLESQVRDRDLALVADLPADLTPIHSDIGKLRQILINLIGNAIKFTERGSVTVRVESDGLGHPRALEVIDTGIGIPREKLATIFEAFQQADVSTTRKYGGTGLGLTIARSLCLLMGYRIEVKSQPDQGSTFRVELADARPRPTAPTPISREMPTPHELPQAGQRRPPEVLVIDDDSDSRLLLSQYLEDSGCRVTAVGSGPEGLHFAQEFQPDLIVLDLMMPGMSGWEVLKVLKAHPELSRVPVVVVSIVAKESRGTLLGAVDLLDKPVSRETLGEMVRRNLLPRETSRPKALVIDDNEDARRLASTYLKEEGFDVREAIHGRDALEILSGFTPDLIILDLMMPIMDGMAFLDSLRAEPCHVHIPVIVVTAKDLQPDERTRLRQDSATILRKGGELEAGLRRILRRVLPGRTSVAELH